MYSPLLLTTSSHLLTNLLMPFHQKSPGLVSKEFVEPVFKVLFIVKGNAPHMVRKRVEKIVIHGCKVWRIEQMLKDLPFELLEYGFDNLCNMRPGVVVKKYGLALSMGSFQLNSPHSCDVAGLCKAPC